METRLANGAECIGYLTNEHGERFVAAETDGAQPFATWQMNAKGATFWGHYYNSRAAAMADLFNRAGVTL